MTLLTPKDIREHTFQIVRFKGGYDVDEVDDFLDQVTETIEALGQQAVQGLGASTQSLGQDVAGLNKKIAELTSKVESLTKENESLRAASKEGADKEDVVSAKLTEAEESNRALSAQNQQLKEQLDAMSNQIDQLTAQAAKSDNDDKAAAK